ncbi:MAG TPA: hypothetical protein VLF95_07260, partial [Vicinamibacteria bacterium]|nr:hypothetical protein [Vicinamibacteria bacterium]
MLLIEMSRIPPEGLDLDEGFEAAAVHLDGEQELSLRPGGRLRGHVEVVDGTTLHVRGRLDAAVEIDCARCLERYPVELGHELDLFYLPQAAEQPEAQEEDVELSDREVV